MDPDLHRHGAHLCRLRACRTRAGFVAAAPQGGSRFITLYSSFMADPIHIAQAGKQPIYLLPKMANRHGLIAGATGTGKTVTLQTLAESFSAQGVPVFMADVKGDLAGISQPGGTN